MRGFVGLGIALSASAVLTACYVVPERSPDGAVIYQHYPLPPVGTVAPPAAAGRVAPATLPVRLYPANDVATRTGVVTGSVTNMMTGKGVFNVSYQGEVLTGEATRVSNEERRGVASAFSPQGLFMSCEYQMNTPYQGAGTCTFSNGAAYQMHIGGTQ
ncbi:MAG: hypothetical protein KGZ70_00885 [Hydrogenophaga sp.]|uniref:hypothetical protein n=1 Tax=Hydrogenophaga sp. TaxID=1904254 RepID=UPI001BBC020F|nr:hypothetical protein [Hydrogenophaga sp.]MBS3910392.1 hypothetical protein [Hydrogenophaga sp.]MDP2164213.1 hypothetical protein [Hydrogenophaga sp.]MDP3476899.1 hypothetical protein [Hydrogenophaga sp.]